MGRSLRGGEGSCGGGRYSYWNSKTVYVEAYFQYFFGILEAIDLFCQKNPKFLKIRCPTPILKIFMQEYLQNFTNEQSLQVG